MPNPYSNPVDPSVPTRPSDDPWKTAKRCEAHSETASKPITPINNTMKLGDVGKLGIKGDGRQK